MVSVALALLSAVGYGCSDFLAGVSARTAPFTQVTLVVQAVGLVVVALSLIVTGGVFSPAAVGWGGLSGLGAGIGTLALYRGLAAGQMSVAAPLSGVGAVVIPVVAGLVTGERPSALTLAGVVVALPAVSLIARSEPARAAATQGVIDGLVAGVGFGMLFLALAQAPADAGVWPATASLLGATLTVATYLCAAGRTSGWRAIDRRSYAGMIAAGLFGAAGPVCYLLATRHGLLVVAAVLAALYPGVTVGLARIVLNEHSRRVQVLGLILAAIAVIAITIG